MSSQTQTSEVRRAILSARCAGSTAGGFGKLGPIAVVSIMGFFILTLLTITVAPDVTALPGAITPDASSVSGLTRSPAQEAENTSLPEPMLAINEFMADNDSFYFDEHGDDDDWIEIHNFGPTQVNMEGKFLTDDLLVTQQWEFPDTTIPAGGYLIVWADSEPDEGPLHTNFKLSREGEQIGLFDYLGVGNGPIDTLSYDVQASNISYGRYPDGTGDFTYMENPTPAAANLPHLLNIPPIIAGTEHSPAAPDEEDTVTVLTRIVDDSAVQLAKVFYSTGGPFEFVLLYDDGAHGDGEPADNLWGTCISPQPIGTTVLYYVWAQDDSLEIGLDPEGAPDVTYSYEIAYEAPALFINEFLASNDTTNVDEFGENDDWLEIYNAGEVPVNIGGMFLTDELSDPTQFELPDTTIAAGGFLLVWCDDDTNQGPLHTNFKLARPGEQIGLFETDQHGNVPIDTLTYGEQTTDISYGRLPDGAQTWEFFEEPTPGESNSGFSGIAAIPPPGAFRVLGMRPNPYAGATTICFTLPAASDVEFLVLDISGRLVKRAEREHLQAGIHHLSWDGTDEAGGKLAAGIYFYALKAGSQRASGRIIRVQ